MENGKSLITERILNLTLEIIYLLTGEESTVVKKTSGEPVTPNNCPHMSGVWNRTMSPMKEASSHSLIHEINNEQKILNLTNKIICLLTGEVPIRSQDVMVYFSMEEWGYIEEHKDVYKDVMMENHQPFISLDDSIYGNSPKRCPSLLNFQDGPDENHIVSKDCQDGGFVGIKVEVIEGLEETYGPCDLQWKKKDTPTNSSKDYEIEDKNNIQVSPGNNISFVHPAFQSSELSSDPFFSDKFNIILPGTPQRQKDMFPCPECGKCFRKKVNLVSHLKSHVAEKPYSCSECSKSFTHKSVLVRHQKIHSGEKPFVCSECWKCFVQKSDLIYHQRLHTGEKPYPCPDCGKCFSHRSVLVRHHKIHTGEKPHVCPRCGKSFIQKTHLKRHQKIHVREKPYLCFDYGKGFSKKAGLVAHPQTHQVDCTFPYCDCEKCFIQRSELYYQSLHTS